MDMSEKIGLMPLTADAVEYGLKMAAIAHERASFTSTNGWCDACGECDCGCHTDPTEKGKA